MERKLKSLFLYATLDVNKNKLLNSVFKPSSIKVFAFKLNLMYNV